MWNLSVEDPTTTVDDSAAVTLLRLADAIEDDPDIWCRWRERDAVDAVQYDDGGIEVHLIAQWMVDTGVMDESLACLVFFNGNALDTAAAPALFRLVAGLPSGGWTLQSAIRAGISNFSGLDLARVALPNVGVPGGSFADTVLAGADLYRAHLPGTFFRGADCTLAHCVEANFTGADMAGVRLREAFLDKANFTEANLLDGVMEGASCADANFTHAFLMRVDCTDANFTRANFTCADLTDATLVRADFTDTNFSGADLTGATRGLTDRPIPGWQPLVRSGDRDTVYLAKAGTV